MPRKLRVYSSRHPEGELAEVEVELPGFDAVSASGELVADRFEPHPTRPEALISLLPPPGDFRHKLAVCSREGGSVLWTDPLVAAATWAPDGSALVVLREENLKKSLGWLAWPEARTTATLSDIESLDGLPGVLSLVSIPSANAVVVVFRTAGDLGYRWFDIVNGQLEPNKERSVDSVEAYSTENREVFYWGPVASPRGDWLVVSAGNAAHIEGLRHGSDVSNLPVGWVFVHEIATGKRSLLPVNVASTSPSWADVFDLLVLSAPKLVDADTVEVIAYSSVRIQIKLR